MTTYNKEREGDSMYANETDEHDDTFDRQLSVADGDTSADLSASADPVRIGVFILNLCLILFRPNW